MMMVRITRILTLQEYVSDLSPLHLLCVDSCEYTLQVLYLQYDLYSNTYDLFE